MGRSSSSPANRLKVLARAKERAAKVKRGEVLRSRDMSKLLEVSWPTLRGWCNDLEGFAESGAFTPGGQGVDYGFHPRATVQFLIKHFTKVQKGQVERARRTRSIVGGGRLADMPEDFDLDDLTKMLRVNGVLREAQERDRLLVDRGDMLAGLVATFSAMQQAGLTAIQQADPTGQWAPRERAAAETAVRTMMTAQYAAMTKELTKLRGGTA